MPEFCSSIIDTLIKERHKKGITQRELAQVANIPPLAIARVESKKNIPRLDTILKIAKALECDITVVSSKVAES